MHRFALVSLFLLAGCNHTEPETVGDIHYQALLSTDLNCNNMDLSEFVSATHAIDIVSVGERTHQGTAIKRAWPRHCMKRVI